MLAQVPTCTRKPSGLVRFCYLGEEFEQFASAQTALLGDLDVLKTNYHPNSISTKKQAQSSRFPTVEALFEPKRTGWRQIQLSVFDRNTQTVRTMLANSQNK